VIGVVISSRDASGITVRIALASVPIPPHQQVVHETLFNKNSDEELFSQKNNG
jgi:hypothetical protein